MPNSRLKNKIYAITSILCIVLAAGSFVYVVKFLFETNEYIFSVNEKTVKEKTIVADKAGFEKVKEKLKLKENAAIEASRAQKNSASEEELAGEDLLEAEEKILPDGSASDFIAPDPGS